MDCSPSSNDAHHPELYRKDGDLVVSAPDKAGGRIFYRIHRFMLSDHSSVFRDMLTMPPAADGSLETFDGIPVVHLPDPGKDLDALLTILYDPSEILFDKHDPCVPIDILGVLKLATKYDFRKLRRRIIEQYIPAWPDTLMEWDHLEQTMSTWRRDFNTIAPAYLDEVFPEPDGAVRLARECNIPEIPPAAFYSLSRISEEDDWNRYHRSMGVSDCDLDALNDGKRTARWHMLSIKDCRCLIKGREKMDTFILNFSPRSFHLGTDCKPGVEKGRCATHGQKILDEMAKQCRASRDILGTMLKYYDREDCEAPPFPELCTNCRHGFVRTVEKQREVFWENIPKMFGLPPPCED